MIGGPFLILVMVIVSVFLPLDPTVLLEWDTRFPEIIATPVVEGVTPGYQATLTLM